MFILCLYNFRGLKKGMRGETRITPCLTPTPPVLKWGWLSFLHGLVRIIVALIIQHFIPCQFSFGVDTFCFSSNNACASLGSRPKVFTQLGIYTLKLSSSQFCLYSIPQQCLKILEKFPFSLLVITDAFPDILWVT